jgi:hypothetical protein
MFTRIGAAAILTVALSLMALAGTEAGGGPTEVAGKVKEVNAAKKYFVLDVQDKPEKKFMVNRETKFTGPRGANHEDGLDDPTMGVGYKVSVVPAKDDQYAKEVKLLEVVKPGDEKAKKGKKGA